MRVFILFLCVVFGLAQIPAFADGSKSFDTSKVPKTNEASAPNPASAPAPQQTRHSEPPKTSEPPSKVQEKAKEQEPYEPAPSTPLDNILDERSKHEGSGMQSRKMPVPDEIRKRKSKDTSAETTKSEQVDDEFSDEEIAEEEKSESEEIWDKYKKISSGPEEKSGMKNRVNMSEGEQEEDNNDEKSSEKEEDSEEEEAHKKEEQRNILNRALSDYKNNKKNKSINQRSYGDLNK